MASHMNMTAATDDAARIYITFTNQPRGDSRERGSGRAHHQVSFGPFREIDVERDEIYVYGSAAAFCAAMIGEEPEDAFLLATWEDDSGGGDWTLDRHLSPAHRRFSVFTLSTVVPKSAFLIGPPAAS